MRTLPLFFGLLVGTALCSGVVTAAAEEPSRDEWTIRTEKWSGALASGASVEIHNPHGDLRVRKYGGEGSPSADTSGAEANESKRHNVHLLAAVQHHQDDSRPVRIVTEESAGKLSIEVRYPDASEAESDDAAESDEIPETWRKRRVDLTVYVPGATTTNAEGADGLLEIRGVHGAVTARTTGGDIEIRGLASVDASSKTGTGGIEIELPRNGRAQVRLETRGEITTDYSVEIRRQGESRLKRGTARIGKKGGELILKSNRGPIKLVHGFVAADEN